MIFSDHHVIVLGADGGELDIGEWSDELDNLAREHGGYVVVIDSEPAEVVADYRPAALFAIAWQSADDCDTCWYFFSDQVDPADARWIAKLRAHLDSGHLTTSEDEPGAS